MTYDLRVVAYTANGARLGTIMHATSARAALPLNDVSALQLRVPAETVGASHLEGPVELALEVSTGTDWVEPPNARFLRLQWELNPAAERQVMSVDAPGYAWLLSTAGIRGTEKPHFNDPDDSVGSYNRRFLSAPAGLILATAISEAKTDGFLPGLTYDFSSTQDSSGSSWASVLPEISYTPGVPILDILENLTEQGIVDWRMEGRLLRVFNADKTLATDRTVSTTNPVALRLGRDVINAPTKGDLSTVAHVAMVRGEGGETWTREQGGLPTPWGKFQKVTNNSNVNKHATAQTILESTLRAGAGEAVEMTRELRFESAQHLALVDYGPGDYIFAPGRDGSRERVRVRQVTLEKGADGRVSGNLVLNDRFMEAAARFARRMNGIQGGSTASGGSTAVPASGKGDYRRPLPPSTGGTSGFGYVGPKGAIRSIVRLTWSAVTTATDGSVIDVSGYQVWARLPGSTQFKMVGESEAPTYDFGPIEPGLEVDFRIYAVAYRTGRTGNYLSLSATTEVDTVAPPRPSPLIPNTSNTGSVVAYWDGFGVGGVEMPADFDYIEIAAGDTLTPTDIVHRASGADVVVLLDRPYDEPTYLRSRALDTSGNASTWSSVVAITPRQATEEDIANGAVGNVHLKVDSVQAAQLDADAINAKHRITGALVQTNINVNRGIKLNDAGLRAFSSSGVRRFYVDNNTGEVEARGDFTAVGPHGSATLDSDGVIVRNSVSQELVRLRGDIPTGLEVYNPATSQMTPLAPVAFTYAQNEYNLPTYPSTGTTPWPTSPGSVFYNSPAALAELVIMWHIHAINVTSDNSRRPDIIVTFQAAGGGAITRSVRVPMLAGSLPQAGANYVNSTTRTVQLVRGGNYNVRAQVVRGGSSGSQVVLEEGSMSFLVMPIGG